MQQITQQWMQPVQYDTTAWSTTQPYQLVPVQQTGPASVPPPKPEPKPAPGSFPGRARDAVRERLHRFAVRRQREIEANILLPMSGGAAEAEVKKRIEHKKKITLTREVGVQRDKGDGPRETHKGTVELVRTMEGTGTGEVGIKTTPNGGTYVEVPIHELREALDELDPPKP